MLRSERNSLQRIVRLGETGYTTAALRMVFVFVSS